MSFLLHKGSNWTLWIGQKIRDYVKPGRSGLLAWKEQVFTYIENLVGREHLRKRIFFFPLWAKILSSGTTTPLETTQYLVDITFLLKHIQIHHGLHFAIRESIYVTGSSKENSNLV